MKRITKKSIVIPLLPIIIAGCNFDKEIKQLDVQQSDESTLFGVSAITGISPWIQSESDNWNVMQVSQTPASMTGIDAVLINNHGQNDTADIQITGTQSRIFMLKSESAMNLKRYQAGYIEFKIRSKSAVPSSMTVSIDNEWPNRSSLVLNDVLSGGGSWETLTVPIQCLQPFDGAVAINLSQVGNPFHLDIKETFDYEITDIMYRLTTERETVVNPDSCEVGSGSGVNQAPPLESGNLALYYSGDSSQAQDYTSSYPINSFGFDVEEENQVVNVFASDNGGVFLGNDDSDKDFSEYKEDFMTLDLKVKNYGETNGIQVRMDGESEEFGLFLTVDNNILPSDNEWYRCQFPISLLIPEDNLNLVKKSLYLSGPWNSMNELEFSFTNVAIKDEEENYNPASPCIKL
ncbi:hypothetical protein EXA20_01070 [Vibrio cincinnatiensis]|uniref:putative glycoside hydrolase n=1 Tax=Vibrio cincinnatiensis TaxID=675 RepID=UPI001EDD543C|nr:putative glycoside hydrolase [Vibrio cincinnatiensis]MCG3745631.1 hypothetical protein [Vibrio cincinnatiensis]